MLDHYIITEIRCMYRNVNVRSATPEILLGRRIWQGDLGRDWQAASRDVSSLGDLWPF